MPIKKRQDLLEEKKELRFYINHNNLCFLNRQSKKHKLSRSSILNSIIKDLQTHLKDNNVFFTSDYPHYF